MRNLPASPRGRLGRGRDHVLHPVLHPVLNDRATVEADVWARWDGYIDTSFGEFGDPFDPDNPYNWDGDDMIGFR